jgi:hypothetical protein
MSRCWEKTDVVDITQSGNDGNRDTLVVTRPPHFPTMHTRETVTHLAAFGLDENQIATILRCTPADVRQHYSEEIEHGLARVNARVMSAVLHSALYNDSAPDRKLWLINKAGWRSGDGPRALAINNNGGSVNGEAGELTVIERREVIQRVLMKATQAKRQTERVIEGEVLPKKTNGANGHGSNGANGTGANGHGKTNGNGAKHE